MTKQYIFLDLETTGLDPQKDEIMEMAYVIVSHDLSRLITATSSIYKPTQEGQKRLTDHVRLLTGITEEHWQGRPSARNNVKAVAKALCSRPDDFILAGHNIAFDMAFMREILRPSMLPLFDEIGTYCTMDACAQDYENGKLASRSLAAAHAYYCGYAFDGQHSALADALASMRVARVQLRRRAGHADT